MLSTKSLFNNSLPWRHTYQGDFNSKEECGANTVRPMLVPPRADDGPVAYYPCLPACTKTYYCCEKPKSKPREESSRRGECRHSQQKIERRPCSPPNNHQDCFVIRSPSPRPPCCEPQCKPTKTKYIIPCYRYEDGRIANQPTVLMRRACEVAIGKRPRKKPYEERRFIRDADHQESRYIREDEEGNCCFHFEKQKHSSRPQCPAVIAQCASCPQYCMEYPPCVTARPEPSLPPNCYYYSCYNPC
ncbi:uncharacterized protein LOC125225865 [Leguminivora glycinivorella]|uniref:uncharacterized protein LOC125225865 n=1 Tax=Leguminivora glycinivorella TaxID=1035111 RepID=UPI00200DD95B|nr:uncharacterized protein LOC125225865 [Leguminivora glycinivorella]